MKLPRLSPRISEMGMIISQGVREIQAWKRVALSIRGRRSAREGWTWEPGGGALLPGTEPHFSAGLEKQKSAQQKAARPMPAGTQLLEGVGTVPAEVAVPPSSGWAPLAGKAFNLP